MNTRVNGLEKWYTFVNEKSEQALVDALAENVRFHSPFLWQPKEGRAAVIPYLSSAARVLEDFTYHREFIGDNAAVLEFSAHVGALSIKGVDILQFNTEGQIVDFEVMVRPANGLQALGEAMARQLASRTPSPPSFP